MRPRAARLAALAGLLLFIALASTAAGATATVNIMNFSFMPATLTINAGDTVTWTNLDQAAHSAVFAGGGPQTPVLGNGQSASISFANAGTFNYQCGIHGASMSGTVVVRAVATPQPTAPPPTPAPTPMPTVPPTVAPTAAPTVVPTIEPTPTASAAPTPTASAAPSATVAPTTAATGAVATPIVAAPAPQQPGANDGANSSVLVIGAAALAVLAVVAFAFTRIRR